MRRLKRPNFQTVNHSLVLHLTMRAFIELRTDGRCDNRARVRGDLSIIPAATVCQVRSREPHEVLVVSLSQEVMAYSELRDYPPPTLALRPYLRDGRLEHICRALELEAASNYVSGPLFGESLAIALGACLLSRHAVGNTAPNASGGMAPQVLHRVIDFMESNLESPLLIDSLAKDRRTQPLSLCPQFQGGDRYTPAPICNPFSGCSELCGCCEETNLSLVEIAWSVGLHGSSQLSALFKREMGTTPGAFRAKFR